MRLRALLAVFVLVAACVACARSSDGSMVRLAPPKNWVEHLQLLRDSKDRSFRVDPESPLLPDQRADFEGLEYWPPDPAFYFAGSIQYYAEPQRFNIIATSGQERPCEKIGRIVFRIDGQPRTLQVYRLLDQPPGSDGLFLPFMDATTGKETYPAGRYVNLDGPQGGPYVLDFNQAYNPSCAYGSPERFACPVTPPENRLEVAIRAGERGYRESVAPPAGAGG